MGVQVVWFKRDLRIIDHEPLNRAAESGNVIPLYIFEPNLWRQPDMSGRHFNFLVECLSELDQELEALKNPLVVRVGRATDVLHQIHEQFTIDTLWSHQETWNGVDLRTMRKKMGVLIEYGKPTGGKWNYDAENRKPPSKGLHPPEPLAFRPDKITRDVLQLVDRHFSHHFGDLEPFDLAVTREQALQVLEHFIQYRLPSFGDYQDAMIQGQPWMYHSLISFYLNAGLLNPIEVTNAAVLAFENGYAPLNAVEGFIRQVIGWREYIRGIYWHFMPEYKSLNALSATRKLPSLYWTADTQMNCLKQCVQDTRRNAYAHHIQRLMVLGNFALLAGIHPDELNEWFLVVYADAYEWVELPNVSGMVLFADGGVVASKPYAASGAYINRMSDYCTSCSYKVAEKVGPDACPFNYLYWDFLMRNKEKLDKNQRMAMIYKSLERMTDEKKGRIQESAAAFLEELQ